MANKILVDTNVLLDYLMTREPFYEDAKKIVLACADGKRFLSAMKPAECFP